MKNIRGASPIIHGQDSEQQPENLTGEAKKMKRSEKEVVRRTCGRGTGADTLIGGVGNDYLNQVMFAKRRVANDAMFEMRRVG